MTKPNRSQYSASQTSEGSQNTSPSALMVGHELELDQQAHDFGDDADTNALLSRKRRDGFTYT